MKLSLIIAPLIAAKVSHEVIMETVLAFEAQQLDALEKRREADRNRQAKKRGSGSVTLSHVTRSPSRSHAGVEDSSSKEDNTGTENREDAPVARGDLVAFKAELAGQTDDLRLAAIVKHRRSKRAQLTAHAARLFLADAAACQLSVSDAIDTCISRNWITVKPDWLAKRQTTAPPKGKTVGEIFRDDAKRMGIIPNDQPSAPPERLDSGNRDGQDGGTGITRRFTLPANVVGRFG